MNLTKIQVTSFKKIAEIEMELAPLNLIIGGNNSGKSSVLQAIHTAIAASQSQIEQGGLKAFAEENLRYSPASDFASLGHGSPFGNRWDQNRAKVVFEAIEEEEPHEYSIELYKGRNPRVVGVERYGSLRLGSNIYSLEHPFSVYVPGLAGVPHFEELKATPVILRKIAGGEANLVLRNVIWQIQCNETLDTLVSNLNNFFPGLDIHTKFDPEKHTTIDIQVRPSEEDEYISLELCGTGILQAIQIFSYVTLYTPTLLLLDEPDAHLHPSNQVKLVEAIRFLNEEYGTITIVATHSRHLMSAAQRNAKFFWLDNGRLKEQGEFELAQVLMEIGGLDEADKIINSQKEIVIFTEDEKKKGLKILLSCCQILPQRYDLVSYYGTSNSQATARLIGSLRPFMRGNRLLIVHRDRDFMLDNELQEFRDAFENQNIQVFITAGSDIESYFLNTEHIAQVNDVEEQTVSDFIVGCLHENEKEIRKRFVNKRREINTSKIYRDGGAPATEELLPANQAPEIEHVVGKDFCSHLRKFSRDAGIHGFDPARVSNVIIAPDLVAILEE
ncbi:AAA family ATPase [Thalassospira alkalitolerans]|uniref:AAA family ATPase n=1 Tax=Thalassospira alkalitolerans TaxID=1293890 RepID=UPI003AA8FB44